MSKNSVVLISGSPSPVSRSGSLLERLAGFLRTQGLEAEVVYASDFPASALIHADVDDKTITGFRRRLADAAAVVLATPIYKATYSGLLKLLVDFIPPDGLGGKTVLTVATGRSEAHFPLVARGFEALLAAFENVRALPTLVISDYQFHSGGALDTAAETAFLEAAEALVTEVLGGPVRLLRTAGA